jgi:hypothetical protein
MKARGLAQGLVSLGANAETGLEHRVFAGNGGTRRQQG